MRCDGQLCSPAMVADCSVNYINSYVVEPLRRSLSEAGKQERVGFNTGQSATGRHYCSDVSSSDPETAAELYDRCATAQQAADHSCFGAFICAPEHLCPNLRREIARSEERRVG